MPNPIEHSVPQPWFKSDREQHQIRKRKFLHGVGRPDRIDQTHIDAAGEHTDVLQVIASQLERGITSEEHDALVHSPYRVPALKTISGKLPQATSSPIEAVILAEPAKAWDTRYKQAARPDRVELLNQQNTLMAERRLALWNWLKAVTDTKLDALWEADPADLYDTVAEIAFGTKELSTINEQFSAASRRGLRLALVHLIEAFQSMKFYREMAQEDPNRLVQNIINRLFDIKQAGAFKFSGSVELEVHPLAIVLTLNDRDFQALRNRHQSITQSSLTSGSTLFDDNLADLTGRVILINRELNGDSITESEIEEIRLHELTHSAFHLTMESTDRPAANYPYLITLCKDALNHSEIFAKYLPVQYTGDPDVAQAKMNKWAMTTQTEQGGNAKLAEEFFKTYARYQQRAFEELAQNELQAYLFTNRDLTNFDWYMLGSGWDKHLERLRQVLTVEAKTLPIKPEVIYNIFHEAYQRYMQNVSAYRDVLRVALTLRLHTPPELAVVIQGIPISKPQRLIYALGFSHPDNVAELAQDIKQKEYKVLDRLHELRVSEVGDLQHCMATAMNDAEFSQQLEISQQLENVLDVIERINDPISVDYAVWVLQMNYDRLYGIIEPDLLHEDMKIIEPILRKAAERMRQISDIKSGTLTANHLTAFADSLSDRYKYDIYSIRQ